MSGLHDPTGLDPLRRPTRFIDSDHPAVQTFTSETIAQGADVRDRAISLYYRVRDEIRYDPYRISLEPHDMKASATLERGVGFCVAKAVVLAAVGRAAGIPTRLGFADVRNHLATQKLLDLLGTDLFVYHGYTELFLDGRWVKATPAFNIGLCEKFGVLPLEFDGIDDSVFHPYDASGHQHMEYVRDHGTFDDLPLELITQAYLSTYPNWADFTGGDFGAEAEAERTG